MDIGIGLPSTIPGVDGEMIVEWARRAEARGFSSLGSIDRLAFANIDSFVAHCAAAAVTERVRLTPSVLLAALHSNHTLFAKQAASLDRLSGGRLVLGVGVGARADDYAMAGGDFHRRGADLDALLERAQEVWRGEVPPVGPEPTTPGGPRVLVGGQTPAAFRRAARFGEGWIASGRFAEMFDEGAAAARAAWAEAGRTGTPRLCAIGYFSLGDDGPAGAAAYLGDYYAFDAARVEAIISKALVWPEQVQERIARLAAAGCDEFILHPCIPDLSQIDLLADAAGL